MSSFDSLILIISTVSGLLLGSFSGLLITRLPLKKPFFITRSKCDHCDSIIPLYLNIPILSFLLLRGKTRCCHKKIPYLHLISEIIMGVVFMTNSLFFNVDKLIVVNLCFFWFYTISIIDFKHWIIPDVLTWGAMPVCSLLSYYLLQQSPISIIAGFLLGFGFFYLLAIVNERIRGTMGLGGGDIKLLGAIGLLVGWKGVFFTVFISSLIGTFIGLIIIILHKSNFQQRIPYGPFLAIACYCYLCFSNFFERMILL